MHAGSLEGGPILSAPLLLGMGPISETNMKPGKWQHATSKRVLSLSHLRLFTRLLCHGILQARTLEWVAMPSSRGSS